MLTIMLTLADINVKRALLTFNSIYIKNKLKYISANDLCDYIFVAFAREKRV